MKRNGRADRDRRKAEAEARLTERAERSAEEQIALLAARPGSSKREIARLTKGAAQ